MNQLPKYNTTCVVIILFLLAWLLSACSSIIKPPGSDLQAMVKGFQHDMRWRYYENAASVVDPDLTPAFMEWIDQAKDKLNVIDWKIREVVISKNGDEAETSAMVEYYWLPSTVIRNQIINQVWRRTKSRWILISQKGGELCFPSCKPKPKSSDPDGYEDNRTE